MDNMNDNQMNNNNQEFNNENPDIQKREFISAEQSGNLDLNNQNGEYYSTIQQNENRNYYTGVPVNMTAGPGVYDENIRNGHINIQSLPVKKHRIRKAAPVVATALIAAILGGMAGGAYVNYTASKDTDLQTPITIGQSSSGKTNPVNYTQPTSLIGKIAAQVGPSIVGVDTKVVSQGFFGQQQVSQDSGSGIIFDKKGYIVTNQHVIDGADPNGITVTLAGGKPYPAQIVGEDAISDIAVLKINADNLPAAIFGDSSTVRVGDLAIAIGNPMGEEFAGTVTSGIISALNRKININEGDGVSRNYNLIQTDAAINPGNSGGALINENGEVIGINSIKFVDTQVEGMNFAIPINEAKTIIEQLLTNGYVSRPWLGVDVITITEDEGKQYNMPAGVGVTQVKDKGGAKAAGIKPRDIILEIDGAKVATSEDFTAELYKHKVGDVIKLKIWRDGATQVISATLGENTAQSK